MGTFWVTLKNGVRRITASSMDEAMAKADQEYGETGWERVSPITPFKLIRGDKDKNKGRGRGHSKW